VNLKSKLAIELVIIKLNPL